ncbi:hypothetical protein GZH47_33065 (plasmid) [Paenibacillus rhizovicinus]|uniref:Uncharacterized protein n=1 Tax=Paenibacillus rhizovicinus TaxID=2704463 RepID=A0A6C0PBJ0_9BACL|nr:hypothetical protein [Paenibacillus rhizovicinus]QHW35725.1 hypothetical protein GZH47_33065 [Paenibacillus rhizovicinus]
MSDKWKIYDRDIVGLSLMLHDEITDNHIPLCEIDVEPGIHDHIVIRGQTYSFCQKSFKIRAAVARRIDLGDEHDTEDTEHAVCPHCGHEDHDCFEWSGDDAEHDCGHCSLPFSYTREVTISYTTVKKGRSYKKPIAEV